MCGLQFGLGALALGDVADGDDRHERPSTLVVNEAAAITEDALPAGLATADAHVQGKQVLSAKDARQRPLVHRQHRAVHVRQLKGAGEFRQMAASFVEGGEAVHVQCGSIEVQQLAVERGDGHPFVLAQGLLRLAALGILPLRLGAGAINRQDLAANAARNQPGQPEEQARATGAYVEHLAPGRRQIAFHLLRQRGGARLRGLREAGVGRLQVVEQRGQFQLDSLPLAAQAQRVGAEGKQAATPRPRAEQRSLDLLD